MSRETTFERDLHALRDRAELTRVFSLLAEQVATDLQRKGYAGRTIGIRGRKVPHPLHAVDHEHLLDRGRGAEHASALRVPAST